MRFLALLQPSQQASRATASCGLSPELSKMCFLRELDDFPCSGRGGGVVEGGGSHQTPPAGSNLVPESPQSSPLGCFPLSHTSVCKHLYSKRQPERPEALTCCFCGVHVLATSFQIILPRWDKTTCLQILWIIAQLETDG